MAIKRQITYSRVAVRLLMAAGAAALMAGCSDASRFSDPFADPFTSGSAPKVTNYRGVDRAPTGAIANPAPARVESRPLPAPAAPATPRVAPVAAAPLPAGQQGVAHWTADGGTPVTVGSGETAAMLATRYGVPTDALLRANGYSTAAQVQSGSRIVIPVYRAGAVAAARPAPAAVPAAPPAPVKVAEAKPDPKAEAAAAREEQRKAEAAARAARDEQAKAERAAKLAREEEAKAKKSKAAAEEQELKRQKKAEAEKAAEEARLAKVEAEKEAAQKAAESKRLADAKAAEAKRLAEARAVEAQKLAEARKAEAKKDAELKAAEAKIAAEKAKLAKAEALKSKADAARAAEAKAEAAKAAEEAKLAKAEAARAAKAERLAKAGAAREDAAAAAAEKQAAVAEKQAAAAEKQAAAVEKQAAAEKQQQKLAAAEPIPAARQVDKSPTASIPPAEETKVAAVDSDKPEFRWPARGRIIQGFSSGGNDGINIAVPEGTPVKAAEGGTVAYAGSELKGYGNLVLIRHPNGFVTAYAHNGALDVKRGDTVKRGQTIAKSGQSGNVGSPQLHFELRKGSTPVDPTNFLAGL